MSVSCTPVPLPLHNNNSSSSSKSKGKSNNNNNKPGRGSHDSGHGGGGCSATEKNLAGGGAGGGDAGGDAGGDGGRISGITIVAGHRSAQSDVTLHSTAPPDAERRCSGSYVSGEQPPGDVAQWPDRPPTPTIIGHEVMEERARFTVYKVLVRSSVGESWVVFRRYTDFSRLNDKLREMFPGFRLALPPKRWFKDNFEAEFLEERSLGLAAFLQNLVAHQDVANCIPVREFLCLDDSPGPFDSLEESRAFCESLEEANFRLLKELAEGHQQTAQLRADLLKSHTCIEALEREIRELKAAASSSGHSTVELPSAVTEDEPPRGGSPVQPPATATTEGASR
uniref:Sorting nexin-16 n=1 Tax=Petromyzon marinus TaxID=7757 RepID=A0AAJ7SJW1_PETMA|nr:sorting nexin-16-like [Petromyzon marinus]XP_032800635.1 sorting nexin-16-like [Petromyzon marinus]XP_032800636.1 sorting nexin-16-like [Petromyzon marinus]